MKFSNKLHVASDVPTALLEVVAVRLPDGAEHRYIVTLIENVTVRPPSSGAVFCRCISHAPFISRFQFLSLRRDGPISPSQRRRGKSRRVSRVFFGSAAETEAFEGIPVLQPRPDDGFIELGNLPLQHGPQALSQAVVVLFQFLLVLLLVGGD